MCCVVTEFVYANTIIYSSMNILPLFTLVSDVHTNLKALQSEFKNIVDLHLC